MMNGISDITTPVAIVNKTKKKQKKKCAQGTISNKLCTPFKIAIIILLLYMCTINAENFSKKMIPEDQRVQISCITQLRTDFPTQNDFIC